MMESTAISLIGLAVLALVGLQNSLMLAFRHKTYRKDTACGRVVRSPYAVIGKIPVAYLAALFYGGILGQLIQMVQQERIEWLWISTGVALAIPVSGYYAYLLFYKLRLVCMACVRLHLINAFMALLLLGYYWFG